MKDREDDGARADPESARDVLLLASVNVPVEILAAQTPGARRQAVDWAAREHMSASDNFGVKRAPKPEWVRLFEVLDADPDPAGTATGRWAGHVARLEGSRRRIGQSESITLGLAQSAVMAQQLEACRLRDRAAAALAVAWAAWREAEGRHGTKPGAAPGLDVVRRIARELLGSDELFEEFARTVPGARPRDEGAAP